MKISITNLSDYAARMNANLSAYAESMNAKDVVCTEPKIPLRLDANEMQIVMLAMRNYIKILREGCDAPELTDKQRKWQKRQMFIANNAISKIRKFNNS